MTTEDAMDALKDAARNWAGLSLSANPHAWSADAWANAERQLKLAAIDYEKSLHSDDQPTE